MARGPAAVEAIGLPVALSPENVTAEVMNESALGSLL